jgi:hypothetical protein
MTDWRIVLCEACGSEGKLDVGLYEIECPNCNGTGGEIIEVFPITLDDLYAMDAEEHADEEWAEDDKRLQRELEAWQDHADA